MDDELINKTKECLKCRKNMQKDERRKCDIFSANNKQISHFQRRGRKKFSWIIKWKRRVILRGKNEAERKDANHSTAETVKELLFDGTVDKEDNSDRIRIGVNSRSINIIMFRDENKRKLIEEFKIL